MKSTGAQSKTRHAFKLLAVLPLSLVVFLTACSSPAATSTPTPVSAVASFRLTVLHNNDAESHLLNPGAGFEDYGGVARFATVVAKLKAQATEGTGITKGVLTLNGGDTVLASPEYAASLGRESGPYYESIALDAIGYDAIGIGTHEFDFGPDVFAKLVSGLSHPVPFLSANLDVSAEPNLQSLAVDNRIAKSTVLTVNGQRIGIVGTTTARLPFTASPRNVKVGQDVAKAVQTEVDALTASGVTIVILLGDMQNLSEDTALAPLIHGVDIFVTGGGADLLANKGALLIPGDEKNIQGTYPLMVKDSTGKNLPIVTTNGSYKYVGKLVADFDAQGNLLTVLPESGPVRVAGGTLPDAVAEDPKLVSDVITPIKAYSQQLAASVVATSKVVLDGQRANIRNKETNEGDLVADSVLWQAQQLASAFGAPSPTVAIANGGGIRNNNLMPAGPISELNINTMVPFPNFVAVIPNVSPAQFKDTLENAISRVGQDDGRFAQVSGFSFTWVPANTARVADTTTGAVTTEGLRIRDVILDNGTVIVKNGVVVPGAPSVNLAANDFIAKGGDQYPFTNTPFVLLGVTIEQAMNKYLKTGLNGTITAAQYPEGGKGRIQERLFSSGISF